LRRSHHVDRCRTYRGHVCVDIHAAMVAPWSPSFRGVNVESGDRVARDSASVDGYCAWRVRTRSIFDVSVATWDLRVVLRVPVVRVEVATCL